MAKKFYVLDTSVYLTDSSSIYSYGNNDIIVPLVVLEELDNNKQDEELRILESVCVQHEIDHLNGITCIDREYKREPLKVGPKIGRNEPCPCGSGKKYKKCHIGK